MHRTEIRASTWQNATERYEHLAALHPAFEPLHLLVSQIASSDYSKGLFSATSMHTLLISQVAEFDRHHEVLEINFNVGEQIFRLEYWEHPVESIKRWTRECSADDGFAVFERFLQLKKWFS